MKTLKILTGTLFYILLVSCADAQFYRSVRGNGNVVKEERPASFFDGLSVSSSIDVFLSQGDKESIVVETDENLQEYLVTEIKNGVLRVYFDNVSIHNPTSKKVYVTMKEVRSLRTSSAGDIIGQTPVRGDEVELGSSSAGNIRLELYARSVKVNISSSGDITLTGEAETLNANLSSAGNLNATGFRVNDAGLSVSSAGDAEVFVTHKLVARASSAGDIIYWGNPEYIDAHSSSAGKIRKR